MSDGVEELRNEIAASYEEIRALLFQIHDDDLARLTPSGVPNWRIAAAIAQAPLSDVRSARRIADGKSPNGSLLSRSFEMIANWRRTRAFSTATRRDLLTAWENAFNALFSCINDLNEMPIDDVSTDRARPRADAFAYLRTSHARWKTCTDELRAAVSAR